MKIIKLEKQHLDFARDFIEPFEYRCCLLAQHIRQSSENLYAVVKEDIISCTKDLTGIFNVDKNFLHCFPSFFDKNISRDKMLHIMINFISKL